MKKNKSRQTHKMIDNWNQQMGFKVITINMFKVLKENIVKTNRQRSENNKKNQTEILEQKSILGEVEIN